MPDPISLITTDVLSAWTAKTFGKSLVEKFFTKLHDEWKKLDWLQASQEYCYRIEQRYGKIQVLGMTGHMELGELFTDVHILEKLSTQCYLNSEHWEELHQQFFLGKGYASKDETRESGDEVAKRFNRLFIIGKPGAGKTTFLKHMAIQTVTERVERLPIFIPLKAFADSEKTLMDFIAGEFDVCGFPEASVVVEYLLSTGKALVLFDGLDEVQTEKNKREQVIQSLIDFASKYPKSQIIISCRIAANDYQFEGFQYVEMADFNNEQILTFVGNWFKNNEIKHKGFIEDFEQSKLQEMAKSPLLLVLLCLVYENTMTLPEARAELYEEAVDALLKKWDISRSIKRSPIYQKLTLGRMRQMLAVVAAENFEKGQLLFRQKDLEHRIVQFIQTLPNGDDAEELDGEFILKQIEANHGILVERAQKVYSFSHLTFQEYFTASYITQKGNQAVLGLFTHLEEDHWREVFLLSAQMLIDPEFFFDTFLQSLQQMIEGEVEIMEFFRWANEKAASVESQYKFEAVVSFYLWIARSSDVLMDLLFFGSEALSLSRALDLDLSRALALDLDLDRARDLALALDLDFVLALARDRARDRDRARARDRDRIIELAKKSELPLLAKKMEALKLSEEPTEEELQIYAQKIETIMEKERNIRRDWRFPGEQESKLDAYLKATTLLVNCLKVAAVANREEILAQILRPLE